MKNANIPPRIPYSTWARKTAIIMSQLSAAAIPVPISLQDTDTRTEDENPGSCRFATPLTNTIDLASEQTVMVYCGVLRPCLAGFFRKSVRAAIAVGVKSVKIPSIPAWKNVSNSAAGSPL